MDKRTEFVEKLSAQMVEWDTHIDRLKDHAKAATAEEKFKYSTEINALQLKRDQVVEKLAGIALATENEWEDIKVAAEQIWSEVKALLGNSINKSCQISNEFG